MLYQVKGREEEGRRVNGYSNGTIRANVDVGR